MPSFGYYHVHTNKADWETAGIICEQEGSHLVVINSQLEARAIENLLPCNGEAEFYIGVSDPEEDGQFRTIFGMQVTSILVLFLQ